MKVNTEFENAIVEMEKQRMTNNWEVETEKMLRQLYSEQAKIKIAEIEAHKHITLAD